MHYDQICPEDSESPTTDAFMFHINFAFGYSHLPLLPTHKSNCHYCTQCCSLWGM